MGKIADAAVSIGTFGAVKTDFAGEKAGKEAARAAQGAAATQAGAQREALDYLKSTEELPQQFREGALQQLGGLYGLEGGTGSQQSFIDQARQSPLYSAILGTQAASEDAILRNQSMTGGLRSGNTQDALAENAQSLQERALLESYNQQLQGVQGMARIPSNANQIAAGTAGIGQTLAQGQLGAAQGKAAAQNMGMNQLMGLATTAAMAFSDIRLKENIEYVGYEDGQNWYKWDWNDEALELGLSGSDSGVMAHEVYKSKPEAIGTYAGYITVDYSQLNAPEVSYA